MGPHVLTESKRESFELPSHDVLSQRARDDPAAYEAWRREVIDRFIDTAPAEMTPRLRGIQFRIDSLRRLSRSALGSTVKIYELMWKSFLHLNQGWQDLMDSENGNAGGVCYSAVPAQGPPRQSARVIEFRPRPPRNRK